MTTVSQNAGAAVAPFRPDIARLRALNNEARAPERLHAHYVIEQELAARLRDSKTEERRQLYGQVYSELFARLPDHPQHKVDPSRRRRTTAQQDDLLRRHLRPGDAFVEIGCGDAAVTQGVATFIGTAIGVDVTAALIDFKAAPANFRFSETSGTKLDLPENAADLIYSNQLMEHLHPDDAAAQLREIYRVLKPGGRYICVTPSRITGPHDISTYFGYEPTGFHLREYDHALLAAMFRDAGFRTARAQVVIKGFAILLPVAPVIMIEKLVLALPAPLRRRIAQAGPVRNLAGVTLVGSK